MSDRAPTMRQLCEVVAGRERAAAHLRAGQQIIKALAILAADPDGRSDTARRLGASLRVHLDAGEIVALAGAMLAAADDDTAREIVAGAAEALGAGEAGPPTPALGDPMEEAAWWASVASRPELEAYTLACLARLSRADRRALLRAVEAEEDAA